MQSIVRKAVRPFMVVLKGIILTLIICATGGAWADTPMTNPVTGETEAYTNTFTGGSDGTDTEWNNADNWDTAVTPFISGGNFDASLVNGKKATTTTQLEGWTPRIGAYNGAVVTFSGGINKVQAGGVGAWLTADDTSSITIASFGGAQLEGSSTYPFKLSSAKAGGITWSAGLTAASNTTLPFWYYLKDDGTVVYGGDITVANAQVIKAADATLTGTSKVASKTLVAFGSGTTKTFTADATVNVYDSDGETIVETLTLATVNSTGATTLTTDDPVGSCELVQTSTGVLLYYVDGTPAAYTPSININFTNASSSGLGTTDNVGYGSYAVPGGSWNNFTVANNANTQTFGTVAAMNSVGVASTVSGAGVTVSGQRGSYNCSSLTAASNLLYGYIDDGVDYAKPTVTITGIPYERYRVIVYAAADIANATFGYMTVNNINYTYVNGALTTGTTEWGNAGADKSANELSEGGNVLVSAVTSGSTATIIGHRSSGTCRGNIAAVQIVEYTPSAGENDLLIELDGDRTYTFDEAKAYDTVYVTGSGTLTFAGTSSTASVLDISGSAAVNMASSALTPTTVTGNGTAIYTGATPTTGLGWADGSKWQGTLWVKNHSSFSGVVPGTMANTNSTLRLSGVVGYFNNGDSKQTCDGTLELENDSYSYAFSVSDGYSTSGITVFAKLKGSGLLGVQSKDISQRYVFKDFSEFTGTFNLAARPLRVILGDGESLSPDEGTITIVSGATATVASGTTWTANKNGFRVEGTLNVNGTLASSASVAIKGSGTVVFTGRAPTPTGDTWWKNAAWTGMVTIKNGAIGEMTFNNYGNSDSTLELSGVTGYLTERNTTIVAPTLKLTDGTGDYAFGFKSNNGWSDNACTIRKLTGSGKFMGVNNANGNNVTQHYIVQDGSEFTGSIDLGKRSMAFGSTTTKTSNKIVIDAGQSITIASGKTWTSSIGELSVDVNGTLTNSGTVTIGSASNSSAVIAIGATGSVVNNYSVSGYGAMTIAEGGRFETKLDNGCWFVNGITINGTFVAANLSKWGSGTKTTVGDTGVLVLTSTANGSESETETNFSRITGTGSLKYEGTGWRALSTNNFPVAVTLINEQAGDLLLSRAATYNIGSLFGSKNFQGNYGSGSRYLNILQSKDTTWSGKVVADSYSRLAGISLDASSTGTLTYSGTGALSVPLAINGGAVNVTGTWVGATTVSGTFGGTGTLTGNLTFNAGSTFKAFASDENGLSVSGTVAYPEEGTVTVDVSDLTLSSSGTTLITFTTAPSAEDIASKMAPSSGAFLKLDGSTLKAYPLVATYNGENYATVQAAIDAAEQAGDTYADVTILDENATCPDEYYIDNGILAKKPAAVCFSGALTYYTTAEAAFAAAYMSTMGTNPTGYDYMIFYANATISAFDGMKIKPVDGVTVTINATSAEYAVSAGAADENGVVAYTLADAPTTYTWTDAWNDTDYQTSESIPNHDWTMSANWSFNNGTVATRYPGAVDTVIIGNGATITGVSGALSVAALQVSGAVTISGGGSLTSDSAITLGASDSITITGTLSPIPTTNVSHSRVKTVTVDGTTTYSVEVIPGTIFSVY